jgi:hypothetical protein
MGSVPLRVDRGYSGGLCHKKAAIPKESGYVNESRCHLESFNRRARKPRGDIRGRLKQARLYGQCYSAKDGKKRGASQTDAIFLTKHDAWNRRVGKIRTDVLLSGQASRRTRCDGGVGCFREWEMGKWASRNSSTAWESVVNKTVDIVGKERKIARVRVVEETTTATHLALCFEAEYLLYRCMQY